MEKVICTPVWCHVKTLAFNPLGMKEIEVQGKDGPKTMEVPAYDILDAVCEAGGWIEKIRNKPLVNFYDKDNPDVSLVSTESYNHSMNESNRHLRDESVELFALVKLVLSTKT